MIVQATVAVKATRTLNTQAESVTIAEANRRSALPVSTIVVVMREGVSPIVILGVTIALVLLLVLLRLQALLHPDLGQDLASPVVGNADVKVIAATGIPLGMTDIPHGATDILLVATDVPLGRQRIENALRSIYLAHVVDPSQLGVQNDWYVLFHNVSVSIPIRLTANSYLST